MALVGGTTALGPQAQPECQQLFLLLPAPYSLCTCVPSLGILQTGWAFQRQSWNSRNASGRGQSWQELPVPRRDLGGVERIPSGLLSGAGESREIHPERPRRTTLQDINKGHSRQPILPAHHPMVTYHVVARGWLLGH